MRDVLRPGMLALTCAALLSGCYGSTVAHVTAPVPTPTPMPTATPSPTPTPTVGPTGRPSPTPTPSGGPLVIHIGFQFGETTDPTYGPVWYYSPNDIAAGVVFVQHGSQVVFENDQPASSNVQHTAGGFGSGGFPSYDDNQNPFTQTGTTIDSTLTWSTGILNPGQQSQVFTVGSPGTYYFGCAFHYGGVPTQTNQSMGDVLVSQ